MPKKYFYIQVPTYRTPSQIKYKIWRVITRHLTIIWTASIDMETKTFLNNDVSIKASKKERFSTSIKTEPELRSIN